jgi:hypothetical protein
MQETKTGVANIVIVVSRILRDYTRGSFISFIEVKDEDIVLFGH